jgi:hypothetical protein
LQVDAAGAWASLVGLVVSVFGFAFAFRQLSRTKKAAEAAETAIKSSQHTFANNQILTLIPQLQALEQDIDLAANQNHRELALRLLNRWRQGACELRALLPDGVPSELTVALQTAILQCARVKQPLLSEEHTTADATKVTRSAIARAIDHLSELASQLRTFFRI